MKKNDKKTCSKCKETKPLKDFYYHRTRKHYMESCKICNDKRSIKYYADIKTNPTPKKVFQRRAGEIYRRCRQKGIPYMRKLGIYLEQLWEQNNHRCYYTGREMSLTGYHDDDNATTIDRILPEKGYVEGNIVLCTSIANRVKQNMTLEDLMKFCHEIIDYNVKE